MYYGIAIAGYTAMVLTAYDASSAGEGTFDGIYLNAPSATAGVRGIPPPAAYDAVYSLVLVPILFGGIGLVVIVLLVSKFRRG